MNSMFEKIQALCNANKTTIASLEKILGLGNSTITKWKNANPNSKQLLLVARYFNVSLDYLMGSTSIPDTTEDILNNKEIQALQRGMTNMPPEERARMMKILNLIFQDYFTIEDNDER